MNQEHQPSMPKPVDRLVTIMEDQEREAILNRAWDPSIPPPKLEDTAGLYLDDAQASVPSESNPDQKTPGLSQKTRTELLACDKPRLEKIALGIEVRIQTHSDELLGLKVKRLADPDSIGLMFDEMELEEQITGLKIAQQEIKLMLDSKK